MSDLKVEIINEFDKDENDNPVPIPYLRMHAVTDDFEVFIKKRLDGINVKIDPNMVDQMDEATGTKK